MTDIKNQKTLFTINNLRLITIIFLIVYSMMQKLSVFEVICKNRIIPLVFLLLAGIVFAWDFFSQKRMFKPKYIGLPILFIFMTGLSALANIKYGIYTNAMIIIYLVIEYAVLYSFEGYKNTAKRDFKIISYTVTIFSMLLSIYTYLSYFLYLDYVYWLDESHLRDQGYRSVYRRAWGFYYETNWQGIIALLVIFLSLYLFYTSKKKSVKIFNIINIIFHFGILVLSGSRAIIISLLAAVFVLIWYLSVNLLKRYDKNFIKQQLLRILSGVVVVGICYGIFMGNKALLPQIQKVIQDNVSTEKRIEWSEVITKLYKLNNIEVIFNSPNENEIVEEKEEFEVEEIERLDIESKEDKSNGRVHLWKDGVEIWLKSPLIGTSPGNLAGFTNEKTPNVDAELLSGSTFVNGYIDLFVNGGLLCAIPILLFLVLCAKKVWVYQKKERPNRNQLGFILACIVAVVPFILFFSDLFYIRSALTYLFVIILGYGMFLMDEDLSKEEDGENLFTAFTPYQLVNAINYVEGQDDSQKFDIYIGNMFNSAEKVADELKNTGLFNTVVFFNRYKEYDNKLISKFVTLFRTFAPQYTLIKHAKTKFKPKKYKIIYTCGFLPFIDSVKLSNPDAELYEYEDGTASYFYNDMETVARSKFFNLINKVVFGGKLTFDRKRIYLNHPELYSGNPEKSVYEIPQPKNLETLKKVFSYVENDSFKKNKTIYLTQPLKETAIGQAADTVEKEILSVLDDKTLIRVHPRQEKTFFEGHCLDSYNNLWEIECTEQINDEHILIGAFSTALFTPKMLCDKEPTVIFTYKLYGSCFDDFISMVDMLRSMYKNPEKVIVAESVEDLKKLLN